MMRPRNVCSACFMSGSLVATIKLTAEIGIGRASDSSWPLIIW